MKLDGFDANFRCVIDTGRPLPSPEGLTGARRGKALLNLGRLEEARPLLQGHEEWLAALELMEGRPERAARLQGGGWKAFYRAAALLTPEAARRAASDPDAEVARAGAALAALLERSPEKLTALEPESGWAWALASRLHREAGRAPAALKALDEAVRRSPLPWILLERSRLHEELGDLPRALRDVDALIERDGPTVELLLRRAHLQVCRRHYHLAAPAYTDALKLSPKDPQLYLGRAAVHSIRRDMRQAVADAARAEALEPSLALERLRYEVMAGGGPRVEKELRARGAAFLRGCHALKRRKWKEAAALFGGLEGPRAAFYRAAALMLDGFKAPPPPKGRPRLLICGLGIQPPFTSTREALRAVRQADFVFNNLSEPEVADLLALLSDEGRPTMFDVRGADARWTRAIFQEMRPGRTVAFVTRGHPLVCGGLAGSLMAACKERGAEFEVYGAVSSMNTLAAGAFPGSDAFWGQQVLDYSAVFAEGFTLDARVPAVVYLNATVQSMDRPTYERFCEGLERVYGRGHELLFYGRNFAAAPERIRLEELRRFHGKLDSSYTLLLPPL